MKMTDVEPDCSYCENLVHVYEEFPSPSEPVMVKNYYSCRANVFEVALTKDELKRHYMSCTVRAKLMRSKLVDELLSEVDIINIVFSQLLGEKVKVVKVDAYLAANLASPCSTQLEFFTKIGFLYNLLDFDREPLRKLVSMAEPRWKGVTLLKKFLAEKGQSDERALTFFEKVILVRNKTYPAHRFDPEVVKVLCEIGLQYPVSNAEDWQRNWDIVLRKCVESFRSLRKALINITKATSVERPS
jgi:hypothetical protein